MNSLKIIFAAIALSGTCSITPALAEDPMLNPNSSYRVVEERIEEVEVEETSVEETSEGCDDITKVQNPTKDIYVTSEKNVSAKEQGSEKIFEAVEQQAQFPGGQSALTSWLYKNLCYPEEAMKHNIEGRVIVQFVIEKDGSITHPVVARGVDKELDMEAIRLIKAMPKWVPGRNNGEAVRSKFTLPVTFRLQH